MEKQAYWSWIDGEYSSDPKISPKSGGVQHGYGVFETLYFKGNTLYHFSQHFQRLSSSAERTALPLAFHAAQVENIISTLIEKNHLSEARVRISLMAKELDYSQPEITSTLFIETLPYKRTEQRRRLLTVKAEDFHCPLSTIKSTSYMPYIRARRQAILEGYDEALLLQKNGFPVECSTANIFFLKDEQWYSPDLSSQGLRGIQFQAVTHALSKLGKTLAVVDKEITDYTFSFICNSLIGLQAVECIDQHTFSPPPEAFLELQEMVSVLGSLEI